MILAADLGSTNIKTAVFTASGERLGEGFRPLPYLVRTNERAELSPEAVAEEFEEAVLEAVRSAGLRAEAIESAAFTSQAQTFCVCDARGHPCGPFIGWTDNRATAEARALKKLLGSDFHRHAGWPDVGPGHLLTKALWWKSHHGLLPDQRLVPLPSFLAMRLGAPLVSDRNLAAMTGFFSIPEDQWWTAALEATGIESAQLGRVVATGEQVAVDSKAPGHPLPSLRSVVMAGNDHTAGAVGCGCSASRSVLTLGTAGVFYRFAGISPGPYSGDGLWGPYPGGGYYELRFIPHACSALDWADEFLFGSVNSPRFVEVAMRAPAGSEGIRFDPDKWGNSEAWSSRGAPEAMACAVLEGIAGKLRRLVPPTVAGRTDSEKEIVVLGGGSRLLPWVNLLAETLGCSLHPSTADGLRGAAKLCGAA